MGKSVFPTKVLAGLSITSTGSASADLMQNIDLDPGLTKRELFAAMAMQGLVANPERINDPGPVLVNVAIAYADALIKELEKNANP
jgi:hypothetical protein